MSLRDDITTMQQQMLPNIPEVTLKMMQRATENLIATGIAARALQIGDKAPDFSLPSTSGQDVSLAEQCKNGSLVINFYRGSWCPYCNVELKVLDKIMPEIRALGANLISISPNLREKTADFVAENPFSFEILSDQDNKIARKFGLVFELAQELRTIYAQFGVHLPEYDGNNHYELPMPATYIIDHDGIIIHAFVHEDYTQRMEPTEIMKILEDGHA